MTKHEEFITFLEGLKEDRAALAALRRGLGEPPGTVAEMGKYIYPFLGADEPRAHRARQEETTYFLVAALFALHPESTGRGDLGRHLRDIRLDDKETAVERRFTQLLAADPADLPDLLRQAVSLLKAKEQPIHWEALIKDVLNWGHPSGFVQHKWARSFWGAGPARSEEAQSQSEGD
jgi:CRISPR system Cascade subunit CasB